MFKTNVGGIDRVLRIVVGLGLLAAFFLFPASNLHWLFLIGIVPLATGLMGWCPAYSIFGMNTCATKK